MVTRLIERKSALAGNSQAQQMQALLASMAAASASTTVTSKSDRKVKVNVKTKLNVTIRRLPPQMWPGGTSFDELATKRVKALSLHNKSLLTSLQ